MLFNAYSPLAGGLQSTYYKDQAYPLDLNGSQEYFRPKTGIDRFPAVTINLSSLGALRWVAGLLPLFDQKVLGEMAGKQPFGPYIGEGPIDPTVWFPNIQGGAAKVGG